MYIGPPILLVSLQFDHNGFISVNKWLKLCQTSTTEIISLSGAPLSQFYRWSTSKLLSRSTVIK